MRTYPSYSMDAGDIFLAPSNVRRRSPAAQTGSDFGVSPGAAAGATLDLAGPGIWDQLTQLGRKAGDKPAQWMKALGTPKNVMRGAGLTAAIPLVLELASDAPVDEKLARATGSLAGLPASALGMALGGGPASPFGWALAALFAAGGSQIGSSLAEGGLNFLKGGPEDAAARAAIKQAETQAKMADILLPAEQRRMQAMTDAKVAEAQALAPLVNDQRLRQALAQQSAQLQNAAMLDQQLRSQNIFG
jgi:hypothetical protein